jgi:hypothetical protein
MERERIYAVAVKIEPTSGTDSVPDPAVDAVRPVGIPSLEMDFLETGERPDVQNGVLITADKTDAGGRWARLTLRLELRGPGTAAVGAAPEADALLRGSGMSVTTAAGVSKTYTTLDTGMETFSTYCWNGSKLFKLVGCSATLTISGEAAKRGFLDFVITGKMTTDPAQAAFPATLAFNATKPPLFHSAAATIGAWTSADADPLVVKSAQLALNNTVSPRPSAGATDGLIGFAITNRATTQTMTVEVPAIATFDPFALSKTDGGAAPVSTWQIGTVAGNRWKIRTGRWSIKPPRFAAQDAIVTYPLEGSLGPGATGAVTREISILID